MPLPEQASEGLLGGVARADEVILGIARGADEPLQSDKRRRWAHALETLRWAVACHAHAVVAAAASGEGGLGEHGIRRRQRGGAGAEAIEKHERVIARARERVRPSRAKWHAGYARAVVAARDGETGRSAVTLDWE